MYLFFEPIKFITESLRREGIVISIRSKKSTYLMIDIDNVFNTAPELFQTKIPYLPLSVQYLPTELINQSD